ncbi:4-hydroxy-tetrahydrodipicolinate synthase [Helicobacter saguini]|uniref:4-hydroxy-tetrahydrodipicolinate synthase n=1 Tax=Helicobacter saguini TaxID=1548018 RepID=A0A347W7H7_9HELI|nr:4-hydroxy-tetrahydrodipicolinate synthase [Helicobacter saguini]MWV68208.1 4-hydroxy-tetrahydrodipicolinate synthase [Helicobacter saguini]MWV70328.1 4-hydroxy-tetrahydrodipicolinate synthase [Helicobacter saguini]MWV72230.1 4-hydroxy-tetrahydrodipicolinate synthase [Helicobacter saguini]TLD95358.1 4-hydroxy-tetrahydrodipicolinate synthase [Helicobacter saguini]
MTQGLDSKKSQNLDSKNALDSTNKKIKVLAGAGSNNTIEAIELAKFAQTCGADAILSVTPYYNKPTPSGLIAHYKAIAKAVDIPIMLYNVPGRTGCDISPELAMQLFTEIPNIYAIKEASGIIERVITLASLESNKVIESKTKKDSNLKVLSGDDLLNYSILTYGGSGVISVTGNLLPDKISAMTESALNGDYKAAQKISNELYEINKILFIESNPIPIKAAMWLSGLLPTLEYRLPLCAPSGENMKKIEQTLRKYEVLK